MVVKTQVPQHHGGRKDQGSRVSLVLALDIQADVTAARLEDGVLATHVGTGDDAGTTDERRTDVGQNGTVKVRHDEDVELLRPGNGLHGGVVDDHVAGLNLGVLRGHLLERAAEKTVGELHDVCLVDAGDLLAVVGGREREGELGDALRLHLGDDLERLDDTGDRLVLQARVLSFGVLADDAHVHVGVTGPVSGQILDYDHRRVDVQFLTERDIERLVTGALDRGEEDTCTESAKFQVASACLDNASGRPFAVVLHQRKPVQAQSARMKRVGEEFHTLQPDLIALQRVDGLPEEKLWVDLSALHTGHVDLLPLHGDVVLLEDSLNGLRDFGTDTVAGNQGDSVFASEFRRLEDVRLDGSRHGYRRVVGSAHHSLRTPGEILPGHQQHHKSHQHGTAQRTSARNSIARGHRLSCVEERLSIREKSAVSMFRVFCWLVIERDSGSDVTSVRERHTLENMFPNFRWEENGIDGASAEKEAGETERQNDRTPGEVERMKSEEG